ncbi:MAG: rhamnogalacturonan acetylesterase [Clostridiales bacterium]|nr:rhamnogalacturonan acetylesterase [Clostridiales bacterium]
MNTIFWAADSTVKQNAILTYPQTGIGQVFHLYAKPTIRIENHAENGRSTKSFLDEGRLAMIYDRIEEGDFLFIQFGHNDEKTGDPARYSDPDAEYMENLGRLINAARNKKAYPVLITPLTRRNYRDDNQEYSHEKYAIAMKKTAKLLDVPLVDLCAKSEALVDLIGEKSKAYYMHIPAGMYSRYPDGLTDNTHLRYEGAVVFAGLIAQELFALGGIYAELLVDGYEALIKESSNEK